MAFEELLAAPQVQWPAEAGHPGCQAQGVLPRPAQGHGTIHHYASIAAIHGRRGVAGAKQPHGQDCGQQEEAERHPPLRTGDEDEVLAPHGRVKVGQVGLAAMRRRVSFGRPLRRFGETLRGLSCRVSKEL